METSTGRGRLSGKTCVITGAARGIGRATALLFAREGARLVLADVDGTSYAMPGPRPRPSPGTCRCRMTRGA
jgi:hypothetical protein